MTNYTITAYTKGFYLSKNRNQVYGLTILILFSLWGRPVIGQDTTFVKVVDLPEYINNVDSDGKYLIARSNSKMWIYESGEFVSSGKPGNTPGRYTWLVSNTNPDEIKTYNSDFFPAERNRTTLQLRNLVPGKVTANLSFASMGNNLFLCFRGQILEYRINRFYQIRHQGKSIRYVFNNDSIRLVATYSGIFSDDKVTDQSELIPGTAYANGEISMIESSIYLNQDNLFRLAENKWQQVYNANNGPKFRKLFSNAGHIWFLAEQSAGTIDLNTLSITTKLTQEEHTLEDAEVINESNDVAIAGTDSTLHFLNDQGTEIKSIRLPYIVYDIIPLSNEIILCTSGGILSVNLKNNKVTTLLQHPYVIKALPMRDHLIFTSFNGLYIWREDLLYPVIENVEFNKKALTIWDKQIFAGSVDGLYILDQERIFIDLLPSLTPSKTKQTNWSALFMIGLAVSLAIITLAYFRVKSKKEKIETDFRKKQKITPELIREAIINDPKILSVDQIAELFNISTVQLNRILKKYDTTGLELLRNIKRGIVKQMFQENKSLEEISARVGYSGKYIRKNFLKGPVEEQSENEPLGGNSR